MEVVDILTVSSLDDLNALSKSEDTRVLDLRNIEIDLKEEKALVRCLLAVRLSEHITEKAVHQVWLPDNEGLFWEVTGRLEKLMGQEIMRKLSMHPKDKSSEEVYKVGKDILNLYETCDGFPTIAKSHPSVGKLLEQTQKSLKKINLFQKYVRTSNIQNISKQNLSTMNYNSLIVPFEPTVHPYTDKRRPGKATFKKISNFKKEYFENNKALLEEDLDILASSKQCYMCRVKLKITNNLLLCSICSQLNTNMLNACVDLNSRYAVVTGARIKIGLDVVLRLLRDGCSVIATTRFPQNAFSTYSSQPDFDTWKHRLKIVQLDLLDLPSIDRFIKFVERQTPHLDILINNAAQTIWRPAGYYSALCERENELNLYPPPGSEAVVQNICSNPSQANTPVTFSPGPPTPPSKKRKMMTGVAPARAEMKWFPQGQLDEHGEQVDSRPTNSWSAGLTDVLLPELLQVLAINSVAPFLLVSKLKQHLVRSPQERKFVVNVSAMEGQFSRTTKGHRHPHTNMAKASLNMLTRTSGLELQMDNIYMTAVDTGWCTDERPREQADHERDEKGFSVPLSCKDGAARIYHPIWHGMNNENQPYFAVFLKDYRLHPW